MNACGAAALVELDDAKRPSGAGTLGKAAVEDSNAVTFAELHQRHFGEVHRFAYWLSGNPHDAADLASEAFVRAWSGLDAPRTETVKAYLFAIVRNLHRRNWRRSSRSLELDEAMADPAAAPDVAADRREELQRTMAAMKRLSELDRTLLLLRAEEDMSYEEIAAVTGLSAAAAKVRVFRARAQLSEILKSTL